MSTNPTFTYADRSSVVEYQLCPRKRWLEREVPTTAPVGGVSPLRANMDLLVGISFHAGVAKLYQGETTDEAVRVALEEEFWPVAKSSGLQVQSTEDVGYVYYEQASLVEALVRGYAEVVLPQNLARFEVVETEREELGEFVSPKDGFRVYFGARADALLLEKDSLDLYVLSLKTAKEHGKREESSAHHDMQGLSEIAVIERRLGKWNEIILTEPVDSPKWIDIPEWFIRRAATGALPKIMGVKMEFALKGRRSEYPPGSGKWSYSNPLIRPWKKGDDFGIADYAFRFEFKDPLGGNHRLGKGWNRINIWEDIGVKAWIEKLRTETIQGFAPGVALNEQFVLPQEYYRNDEDMEDVIDEIIEQERFVAVGRATIAHVIKQAGGDPKVLRRAFSKYFRKQTKSCDYPSACEFQDVCFGPRQYTTDPISSGLYQIREANHGVEKDIMRRVREGGV